MIKRALDLLLGVVALMVMIVPMLIIAIVVKLSSKGPILYWSDRIGAENKIFYMPKFRTMVIDTPTVATHELNEPEQYYTPIGSILRKSSLDELPQLWNILLGQMSFVGPRPALFSQKDLIEIRTDLGVHLLRPGLTGWAQINGRDEISIKEKAQLDKYYLDSQSLYLDLKIIFLTAYKVMRSDGVSH